MSICIRNVSLNGQHTDVFIEHNRINRIGKRLPVAADIEIDGARKALIPGFVNTHTHAAMTLFRGYGDDMPLMAWLEQKIWPAEAKLTKNDVYWGTKLACLEMIKSGTTTFVDMYHSFSGTAEAVEEMGIRALLSGVCFDHFDPELRARSKAYNQRLIQEMDQYSDRISYAIGPHAIYTVSGELLQWIHQFSIDNDCMIHMHLAETEQEVRDCVERFGTTPVRYLHKLGILSPRLIAAHVIYVDDEEIDLLASYGVKVVHNPASNMKLGSGIQFKFTEMQKAGITVGLGTDGCSSSNNLDMVEAMKLASLLGKGWRKDPEVLPVSTILEAATYNGAQIARIPAGEVREGALADLCLVDLNIPAFTPNHNFESNLVYAANGSCIDTVICDGKILMQNKKVPGEEEILAQASAVAADLLARKV